MQPLVDPTPRFPHLATGVDVDVMERVELLRLDASTRIARDADRRRELGQFLTPVAIGRFMADMLDPPAGPTVRLLDAGSGSGVLTAAAVERLCTLDRPPSKIIAELWEVDPVLLSDLRVTLELCRDRCERAGVELAFTIYGGDFIDDAVARLASPLLRTGSGYDLAVLNPPYRKLRSDSDHRAQLRSVGIETSNLYAAFVWLASELLGDGGQLVAITPRSFMNGTYFRPFRRRLVELLRFRQVHVYDSRNAAFSGDDVLQENAIIHAVRGGRRSPVVISTSAGPSDDGLATRTVPSDEVIDPNDPEAVMHVVPDGSDAAIRERMQALPHTLADLGVTVSTGRVVEFRSRELLSQVATADDAPLICPRHLTGGRVTWPVEAGTKPNAIAADAAGDLLLPSGWYVLVKRFSAKEERRRVVAALHDPAGTGRSSVGFDNKLNVLHVAGSGLSPDLARGIAVFLNSTLVDAYFRQFSGHTQVNAGDLRTLRFPPAGVLVGLGGHLNGSMPPTRAIDALINKEVSGMSDDNDPVSAKQKVEDALAALKAVKVPKAQQNERSALTLLGLLDLDAGDDWTDASAPLRGVTELMDWMAESYGKKYAPNTRETIRRYTLHQFIEAGLVVLNPDKPTRPPNSPKNVYQVEPATLALLRTFGTAGWDKQLADYLKSTAGRNRLREQARDMKRLPVTLTDGSKIELSPGGQNVLVKEIIEQFAPRFTPAGRVLYVGDAGEKHLLNDVDAFAELGVTLDPHGKMPDVVIHDGKRDWLILVEAVTSHGPVNMLRHNQLKDLFAASRAGLVFVTTFLDRKAMRDYLPEIAWETEVWVADAPDHLIHFNGERFLGPYAAG